MNNILNMRYGELSKNLIVVQTKDSLYTLRAVDGKYRYDGKDDHRDLKSEELERFKHE